MSLSGDDESMEEADYVRARQLQQTRDSELAILLRLAESNDGPMSLTVASNGVIVSGLLIGSAVWLEQQGGVWAQMFRDFAERGELVDTYQLRAAAAREAGSVRHEILSEDDRVALILAGPHYLHLRDARFVNAQGVSAMQRGFLWRARVDSIDGWMLGQLT